MEAGGTLEAAIDDCDEVGFRLFCASPFTIKFTHFEGRMALSDRLVRARPNSLNRAKFLAIQAVV
jgi:hypothetical protein